MESIFVKAMLHKSPSRNKGTAVRCLRLESLEDRRMLATFTVSSTADAGPDTLRRALELANLNPGPDDVVFDEALSGSTITLAGSELYSSDTLTIDASPLTENVTIDANQGSRVIHSVSADLTIAGLTLLNGNTTSGGGGIRISDGSLTLTESIVSGNNVTGNDGFGGGIYSIHLSNGVVILNDSTVSDNSTSGFYARGGGIYSRNSVVTLNDSTVSGNSASGTRPRGGGIHTHNGDVTLNNSLVNDNSLSGSSATGGGIYALYDHVTLNNNSTVSENTASASVDSAVGGGITSSSIVTVTNSTVSENTATSSTAAAGARGGGISAAEVTLTDSTVSGNQAAAGGFARGGGIHARYSIFDSGVTLTRSTVSGNNASANTSSASGGGIHVDNSYSSVLLYDSAVSANTASSNGSSASGGGIVGGVIDAMLGPLADNGGSTQTRALLPASPAIDAGDPAAMSGVDGVPLFDQRGSGFFRISDGKDDGIARLDMGAFEVQGVNVEPIADAGMDQTTLQALPASLDGSGSSDEDGPEPLTYFWKVLNGPGPATLGTPNAVTTSFQAETIGSNSWDYFCSATSVQGLRAILR